MERRVGARLRVAHLMGGVALAALPAFAFAPAFAQETVQTQQAADTQPQNDEGSDRVVVTGSLIRGVSPVGTNSLTIDEDIIEATGASNTNQVLATLPLVSNAFNTNTVNLTDVGTTTFRPNIRNIGAAGGNSTLVLINGNNQVGAGILQTTPDSGVIPPGMLSRVEVLADGGSSLYGADAIGGIVNFITKRRQDGTRVDLDYGFTADGYESASLNVTTGFDWDGGNAVLSAFTRSNSELLAGDRDLPRQNLQPFGGTDRRTTACDTPNFTVGATTYTYTGSAFATGATRCEGALGAGIVPQERQNALYGFLTHSFTDDITFEVTANYSDRVTKSHLDIFDATNLTIPTTNFYYTPIPGAPGAQAATFSYAPAFGPVNKSRGELETYQITPTLIWDIGNDWEIKGTYNYGWSNTTSLTPQVNAAAQTAAANGTTAATALNPYNIAATNPGVLANIRNSEIYGENTQTLSDTKLV
ncbi:MAG: TonB-dependent receptor plug domain-containing protein, partial [Vicinamibacterales bacterium]